MRVRLTTDDLARLRADLAVCFAYEGDSRPRGVDDQALRRDLAAQMKADAFGGRAGDRLIWSANGRYQARRFLVLGLGSGKGAPAEAIRFGCAAASRAAGELAARTLAVRLPDAEGNAVRAATEGALLGSYRFEQHLTEPTRRTPALKTVQISVPAIERGVRPEVERASVSARAVALARDLVNEAPSRMNPTAMARVASREAKRAGLRSKVYGPAELQRVGLGALLAVARGSAEPARVVHLAYKPQAARRSKRRIVLVGKGVTFDSGGLNLKPGNSMLTMKCDMAGAAAVLATMTALRDLGCRAEVHAYLGLVENMTAGTAYKPGDILETWSGKTVEIGNTDAEGRLVLCDLLAWSVATRKPTHVVDVATLTGACVVALGLACTGLFTRHDALADELLSAAGAGGEKLWRLPLIDDYLSQLQKGPADLRNVGGRWGGAITAALFLGEFLPRDLPWAHLDIAGPAFNEEDSPVQPLGGTGASVMTLLRWLETA